MLYKTNRIMSLEMWARSNKKKAPRGTFRMIYLILRTENWEKIVFLPRAVAAKKENWKCATYEVVSIMFVINVEAGKKANNGFMSS